MLDHVIVADKAVAVFQPRKVADIEDVFYLDALAGALRYGARVLHEYLGHAAADDAVSEQCHFCHICMSSYRFTRL